MSATQGCSGVHSKRKKKHLEHFKRREKSCVLKWSPYMILSGNLMGTFRHRHIVLQNASGYKNTSHKKVIFFISKPQLKFLTDYFLL